MLGEIGQYLTTPAATAVRRMGLLTDAVGLWSRARRMKRVWREHYDRCHGVIRAAMADLPSRRTALVLGSGLCEDVPLEALCGGFERVILVDVVHLSAVRRAILSDGRFATKVAFETIDLTGRIEALAAGEGARRGPLAELAADAAIDIVISANCLSQLPRALIRWLERRRPGDEQAIAAIGPAVVSEHLDDLARFACPVVLLTDTAYTEFGPSGGAIERHDLLHGRTLPPPDLNWDWPVAPPGEGRGGRSFVHHVSAYGRFSPRRL